jgi:16S rRNA (cytidine1402-2'-O)-methyltransferase
MLYIVATPIGNLKDITLRAVDALKECDYILCEDTKISQKLLYHFEIKKNLISYHRFNEKKLLDKILYDLEVENKDICLISDAGTSIINDPGAILIQKCIEKKIAYTSLPGACSVINAITLSGLKNDNTNFAFFGFLPKKENDLSKCLNKALKFNGLLIFFETAIRLPKTLKILNNLIPDSEIAILREMTKKFEEKILGKAKNIYKKEISYRGEIVLIISNEILKNSENKLILNDDLADMDIVDIILKIGNTSLKDAVKITCSITNSKKNDLYKKMIEKIS